MYFFEFICAVLSTKNSLDFQDNFCYKIWGFRLFGLKSNFLTFLLFGHMLGNFLMSFSKWRNWKKDLVHNWERVKRPNYRKLVSTCAMPCTNTASDWTIRIFIQIQIQIYTYTNTKIGIYNTNTASALPCTNTATDWTCQEIHYNFHQNTKYK